WPSGVAGRGLRGTGPFWRPGLSNRRVGGPRTHHRADPARSPANPAQPPQIGLGASAAPSFSPIPDSPMNLLTYLLGATARWAFVFPQERRLQRAIALAFGILCGVGRRTVTRAISFHGNTQKDWSADYKVFSRSPWEARALFQPILEPAIQEQKLQSIVISPDDNALELLLL